MVNWVVSKKIVVKFVKRQVNLVVQQILSKKFTRRQMNLVVPGKICRKIFLTSGKFGGLKKFLNNWMMSRKFCRVKWNLEKNVAKATNFGWVSCLVFYHTYGKLGGPLDLVYGNFTECMLIWVVGVKTQFSTKLR